LPRRSAGSGRRPVRRRAGLQVKGERRGLSPPSFRYTRDGGDKPRRSPPSGASPMPRLAALLAVLATGGFHPRLAAADRPLKVPDGFEVVKVAGPPLVNFPVAADFDEQGRLYVT